MGSESRVLDSDEGFGVAPRVWWRRGPTASLMGVLRLLTRMQKSQLAGLRLSFVVFLGLFVFVKVWTVQGRATPPPVFDVVMVLLAFGAAALCLAASWRPETSCERWAWRCLALAYGASAMGESRWLTGLILSGQEAPAAAFGDVGALAYYPFMCAALVLLLPRNTGIYGWMSSVLDALLFTAGPLALCWWVAKPVWTLPGGPLGMASNGIWPSGDFLLTFMLVMLVVRWPLDKVPRWLGFLLGAFLAALVAHSINVILDSAGNSALTPVLDPLYACAFGLAARAGAAGLGLIDETPTISLARWRAVRVLLPYAAVPVVGLVVYAEFRGGVDADTPQVLIGAGVVIVIVLARQLLMLLENDRLSQSLALASADLEQRVQLRTAELAQLTQDLSALNRVATSLSHCQTSDEVQETGLAAGCEALGADAGAIWMVHPEGRLELLAQRGFGADGNRLLSDLPRYAPSLARLITAGEPVHLHADQLLFGMAADIWDVASRPYLLLVPLRSRSAVLGALCLATSEDPAHSTVAADFTQAIGAELGIALENAHRYESVKDLAEHDPLTGVLNRRALFEQLTRELRRAQRQSFPLSLVIIDLDGFKTINDTHGHSAGDRALRRVARLLVACARGSDTVARFGGDEFVVVAPDTNTAGAVALAQRIKRLVSQEDEEEEGPCPKLRLSFGIATVPTDARDAQMLVERADANLYRSKQAGGDTITACESATPEAQRSLESYRPRRQARAEASAHIVTPLPAGRPHEVA